jgi:hypothetical protein
MKPTFFLKATPSMAPILLSRSMQTPPSEAETSSHDQFTSGRTGSGERLRPIAQIRRNASFGSITQTGPYAGLRRKTKSPVGFAIAAMPPIAKF